MGNSDISVELCLGFTLDTAIQVSDVLLRRRVRNRLGKVWREGVFGMAVDALGRAASRGTAPLYLPEIGDLNPQSTAVTL